MSNTNTDNVNDNDFNFRIGQNSKLKTYTVSS